MKTTPAMPFEQLGIGALGLMAIIMAGYSTAARYLYPSAAPDWGEEVVVYLSVWALWLAAGSLARRGAHIRAEFLVERLGPRAQHAFELFHAIVGILFTLAMGYAGLRIVLLSIATGERSESTLGLPLALYYAAMPVGMVLMLAGYAVRLLTVARAISGPATRERRQQ